MNELFLRLDSRTQVELTALKRCHIKYTGAKVFSPEMGSREIESRLKLIQGKRGKYTSQKYIYPSLKKWCIYTPAV